MLWNDFEACRRPVRPEWESKLYCMWVFPILKSTIFIRVSNIPSQTCFRKAIQAHCERHSSPGQWTLTTCMIGKWFENSNSHIHVFGQWVLIFFFNESPCPSCHPYFEKKLVSQAPPTWEPYTWRPFCLLKLWSWILRRELISSNKWLITKYVGDRDWITLNIT
jgi:hypothetical protein